MTERSEGSTRSAQGIREAIEAIDDPIRLEALLDSAFRSEAIEAFAQKL
jgi:hypothetical protein